MYEIRTFDANELDGQIWISETTETIVLQSGDVSVVSEIHTWPIANYESRKRRIPFPRFRSFRDSYLAELIV